MRTKSKTLRMPRGRPPLSSDQVDMMRKRIADAARRLFRDEGFEAVSMRRLATEAGCTPMSLYTYFDGKIDVLRSVWGDVFADAFAHVARAKAVRTGAAALLHAKCRAYVQYWIDHPDAYRIVFMSAGVTQGDVTRFVEAPVATAGYRVFVSGLSAATGRTEAEVVEPAQALICGLHGIAHSHITISGFRWAPAHALTASLVEGVVLAARKVR